MHPADAAGNVTPWLPCSLAAAKAGGEDYRREAMELHRFDRVRVTCNDLPSGLASGETATVESVGRTGLVFRLHDGNIAKPGQDNARLGHVDRAFAGMVHAFQGRTVDRILTEMPAESPDLVNQRAFYVAVSRAGDAARLVTDDARKLADRLERATGEHPAALDATARQALRETVFRRDAGRDLTAVMRHARPAHRWNAFRNAMLLAFPRAGRKRTSCTPQRRSSRGSWLAPSRGNRRCANCTCPPAPSC